MCVCVQERHTMRGRHTEKKDKETKTLNEKETRDKTALKKEEMMTVSRGRDAFHSVQNLQKEIKIKSIQKYLNAKTSPRTYDTAHPGCTDSYCRT